VVEPVSVLGVEVAVSTSIGVALPPPPTGDVLQDIQAIIRLADHAMYDAKRAGGGQTTLATGDADALDMSTPAMRSGSSSKAPTSRACP
jgi:predicted signal transduction protein with EAL and GGDEF domain